MNPAAQAVFERWKLVPPENPDEGMQRDILRLYIQLHPLFRDAETERLFVLKNRQELDERSIWSLICGSQDERILAVEFTEDYANR